MHIENITDGERLYYYLLCDYDNIFNWANFSESYEYTGRSEHLSLMFKELIAVNLVGRILSVGSSVAAKYSINDPLFAAEFKDFLREYLTIRYYDFDKFYRLCYSAVKASKERINESTRKKIQLWSKRSFPHCYMCGVDLEYVETLEPNHKLFTLEHLWPQSYGGNSFEENLLPACLACNSKKKRNFATWVMPAIQSLIYPPDIGDQRLNEIDGSFKFALHYKYVQNYSKKNRKNLKRSFLEIGPWKDVKKVDPNDVADFFNLSIT